LPRREPSPPPGVAGASQLTPRPRRTPQGQELAEHTSYTEAALLPCVRDIHELHKNATANSLQAVRKKYAQEKHGAVSGIAPANLRW